MERNFSEKSEEMSVFATARSNNSGEPNSRSAG